MGSFETLLSRRPSSERNEVVDVLIIIIIIIVVFVVVVVVVAVVVLLSLLLLSLLLSNLLYVNEFVTFISAISMHSCLL